MDEGFAIGRGISGLSSFASGWAKTKMFLDQQATAEDQWRKEFFFKQDEAMRRNMEADRRWNFEMEKWESGEELRGINNATGKLQLKNLDFQWKKSQKEVEETPAAMGAFANNYRKLYVENDPEETGVRLAGFFTKLKEVYPNAETAPIERMFKLLMNSTTLRKTRATMNIDKVDPASGRHYVEIVDKATGAHIENIFTGKLGKNTSTILMGVNDSYDRIFDEEMKAMTTAIGVEGSMNKGMLMLMNSIKQKDRKLQTKALLRTKATLEANVAKKQKAFREDLDKQLRNFVKDPGIRKQMIDGRLGPQHEMVKARSVKFFVSEFQKNIDDTEEAHPGKYSLEDILDAQELNVANELEGDDQTAALDAIEKLEIKYFGHVRQESDNLSFLEKDLTTEDYLNKPRESFWTKGTGGK